MSKHEEQSGAPQDSFELLVCGFEKSPAHCVYLNDYRVAGGKPWGGGRTTASWRITLDDLRQAFPELEIRKRASPAAGQSLPEGPQDGSSPQSPTEAA